MQVSEVMHKGVVTAQIKDSIRRIANIMKKEDIGAIPIYKHQRPVGFVTDRDIVLSSVANGVSPDDPISKAMKTDIFCVKEHQDIKEAIKLMEDKQISRLLVVNEGEMPVGMLTLRDICLMGDFEDKTKAEIITEIKRS